VWQPVSTAPKDTLDCGVLKLMPDNVPSVPKVSLAVLLLSSTGPRVNALSVPLPVWDTPDMTRVRLGAIAEKDVKAISSGACPAGPAEACPATPAGVITEPPPPPPPQAVSAAIRIMGTAETRKGIDMLNSYFVEKKVDPKAASADPGFCWVIWALVLLPSEYRLLLRGDHRLEGDAVLR
jgi:hypothetical protein